VNVTDAIKEKEVSIDLFSLYSICLSLSGRFRVIAQGLLRPDGFNPTEAAICVLTPNPQPSTQHPQDATHTLIEML